MSIPTHPDPAKLVAGMFTGEKDIIEPVAAELVKHFGDIDLVSKWLAFDYTDYYTEEFGAPLYRRFFSFTRLIQQDELAGIKRVTNMIEQRMKENGNRRCNIDPGYMLLERFVLATGKNYSHRIYIGDGIYADLTLMYHNGGFRTLPWTYPDYADSGVQTFLMEVRKRYNADLQSVPKQKTGSEI